MLVRENFEGTEPVVFDQDRLDEHLRVFVRLSGLVVGRCEVLRRVVGIQSTPHFGRDAVSQVIATPPPKTIRGIHDVAQRAASKLTHASIVMSMREKPQLGSALAPELSRRLPAGDEQLRGMDHQQ